MSEKIIENYLKSKKRKPFRKRLINHRRKQWDKGDYYDPKLDFRPVEKRKWFRRKKKEEKDEYEKGKERVKKLIK